MKQFLFGVLVSLFLIPSGLAFAQTACGSIIIPEDVSNPDSPLESTPIEDCSDPFEKTIGTASPYTLTVAGEPVSEGETVIIPEGGTTDFLVIGNSILNSSYSQLFLHDGTDYRFVATEPFEPQESDYRELADSFFEPDSDGDIYVLVLLGESDYFDLNEAQQATYNDFSTYVDNNFSGLPPKIRAGTYTLVITEDLLVPTRSNVFEKLYAAVVKTAHAQTFPHYVFTVTFTLEEEPVGASSVLFLPGIMGSRLYEVSDVCDSGISVQERWFSTDDCNQLRLKTSVAGASINDIYTKAGNDGIIDEALRLNLYKTFLETLETWKETDVITDYRAIPYDWRLRLDDVLKAQLNTTTNRVQYDVSSTVEEGYLYKTLKELADSPLSGKVTIVAHSNGGLVAKRLLAHLTITNDPLLEEIDNLILVGVPQVGTPSTLLGLLHGDEIGLAGAIVSQQTTRELMNTMPFAFHLLPNQSYFSSAGVSVSTPAINFENGSLTTPWVNTYGANIATADSLKAFLSTQSGRTKPIVNDLATPEVVDTFLFNYAANTDTILNSWVPPDSLQVSQIAGTGLPTQTGITYFTDSKCVARDVFKLFKCTAYAAKLGMRPNETIDGDETVVTPSALVMSSTTQNVERWWLNLELYNSLNFDRRHKDIFEVQDVIDFIKNTLDGNAQSSYEYLANTPTVLPSENRLVFNLHSPLDLKVVASGGKEVSSSTETIEGGVYKRFGEMQHISIPDTGTPVTLKLQGTAYGSFTLEVEEYNGSVLNKRHTYSAVPSSSSTKVSMVLSGTTPIEDIPLVVDYDGNGTPEISYDTEGEIVSEITYATLFDALNTLTIKPLYKKLLLENAKTAKQFYEQSLTHTKYKKQERKALNVLKQQVLLYERLRILTVLQKQDLVRIVDRLINK